MKKLLCVSVLICLSTVFCFAQKIVKIEKPTQKTSPVNSVSTEISDKEWQNLNDAMRTEKWNVGAFLASGLLERLGNENDKKQLAQLRYFYLYSLAGKVISYSEEKNPLEEKAARLELQNVADEFIGTEILMPPRQFIYNCSRVLNYICSVKDNENALRVTATNQAGTSIHSFETVLFDQKVDLKEFIGKETFLGGTLAKVEFNPENSNLWIMRLFFVKGFVRVIVNR